MSPVLPRGGQRLGDLSLALEGISKRGTLSQLSTAQGEGVEKERAGEGHLECQEG